MQDIFTIMRIIGLTTIMEGLGMGSGKVREIGAITATIVNAGIAVIIANAGIAVIIMNAEIVAIIVNAEIAVIIVNAEKAVIILDLAVETAGIIMNPDAGLQESTIIMNQAESRQEITTTRNPVGGHRGITTTGRGHQAINEGIKCQGNNRKVKGHRVKRDMSRDIRRIG